MMYQITRSHYQNAVTATRMDSSPQTPDADARLSEGNQLTPDPPATEHGATLMPPPHNTTTTTLMPPPREPSRPGSARTRGQQSSVTHSTSLLNEKNRIVRKYPRSPVARMKCWRMTVRIQRGEMAAKLETTVQGSVSTSVSLTKQ